MRRPLLAALAGLVSACGLLSGLDALQVGDAGADATHPADTSTGADGAQTGDAGTDAKIDDAALPDALPIDDSGKPVVLCGPLKCKVPGEHCCATTGVNPTYNCSAILCPQPDISLSCDDRFDCPDATPICCLTTAPKVSSLCVGLCSSASSIPLCVPGSQPTGCGGTLDGPCTPFDSGYPVSLGRCD